MPKPGRAMSRKNITRAGEFVNMPGPSSKGQQRTRLILSGIPQVVSSSAGNVIAAASPIDPTNTGGGVKNWATRFGNVFEEYRVVGVDYRVMPAIPDFNAGSSAICYVWYDETSTSTPTLAEAQEKTSTIVNLATTATLPSAANNGYTIRWRGRDFTDESWTATATSKVVASFKMYADQTVSPYVPASLNVLVVQPIYHVEFRGIKGV